MRYTWIIVAVIVVVNAILRAVAKRSQALAKAKAEQELAKARMRGGAMPPPQRPAGAGAAVPATGQAPSTRPAKPAPPAPTPASRTAPQRGSPPAPAPRPASFPASRGAPGAAPRAASTAAPGGAPRRAPTPIRDQTPSTAPTARTAAPPPRRPESQESLFGGRPLAHRMVSPSTHATSTEGGRAAWGRQRRHDASALDSALVLRRAVSNHESLRLAFMLTEVLGRPVGDRPGWAHLPG